ncbi:MAG: radical SAM protein [Promethearchaeota archaeon]
MKQKKRFSIFPICLKPWTSFEIDDAIDLKNVRPCCWSIRVVGDLDSQSIGDIWNGEGFREFRERLKQGDLTGICDSNCPNLTNASFLKRTYLREIFRKPTLNKLTNFLEIIFRKNTLNSSPLHFKVTPSLACNLDCIMCYQNNDGSIKLPDFFYTDLSSYLKSASTIHVQGGEIFASSAGIKFLKNLDRNQFPNLKIGIITNGTFPHSESWSILKSLRLDWIIVSVDAANKETFEFIRRKAAWEEILSNIEQLVEIRNQTKKSFQIYIDMTVILQNFMEIPEFIELAFHLGVFATFHCFTSLDIDLRFDVLSSLANSEILIKKINEGLRLAKKYRMAMATTTLNQILEIHRSKMQH